MPTPTDRPGLARHLPYLRRYARTLTGSQEKGDRFVRVCLETLIVEPERVRDLGDSRLSLYRLFHEVWRKVATIDPYDSNRFSAVAEGIEDHLQALPPVERQLLLLTTLESFSVEEAAQILMIETREAERMLERLRLELTARTATTVLVVEDEPVIAFDITEIVSEMGHRVVGYAQTKDEAVEQARKKKPGIVLADIQLGDGSSGIDAVGEILESMEVPVIFVTAYPERLLTGEGKEPAYLVTKPFKAETLRVTIDQALLLQGNKAAPTAMVN